MFCKQCGNEIPNDVAFCTHCGNPVQQDQQPQQPNYAQPNYAQPNYAQPNYNQPYGQPYGQPMQPVKSGFPVVSLILGIVSIVFFLFPTIWWLGLPAGIVGIIFGVKEKKKTGKGVGFVLSIVGTCLNSIWLLIAIYGLIVLGSIAGAVGSLF